MQPRSIAQLQQIVCKILSPTNCPSVPEKGPKLSSIWPRSVTIFSRCPRFCGAKRPWAVSPARLSDERADGDRYHVPLSPNLSDCRHEKTSTRWRVRACWFVTKSESASFSLATVCLTEVQVLTCDQPCKVLLRAIEQPSL
jgi:hypothetical protein